MRSYRLRHVYFTDEFGKVEHDIEERGTTNEIQIQRCFLGFCYLNGSLRPVSRRHRSQRELKDGKRSEVRGRPLN